MSFTRCGYFNSYSAISLSYRILSSLCFSKYTTFASSGVSFHSLPRTLPFSENGMFSGSLLRSSKQNQTKGVRARLGFFGLGPEKAGGGRGSPNDCPPDAPPKLKSVAQDTDRDLFCSGS